ncbi:MAG: YesL family protein [Promicromonosporaceae bacterium]|nr:YesL family protein [Promicromonosporaceae bacterium]
MSDITPFDPPIKVVGGMPLPGDIGHGILGKISLAIYWYLVLTLLIVVSSLPAILLLLLLQPVPQNFFLIPLAMIPIGPAISAGLYAVRARYRHEDRGPWRSFVRGYRMNFVAVIKLWIPFLVVLGIIAFTLTFGGFIGLNTPYRIGLSILAALLAAWAGHAIAIATFFNFRSVDVARLATYYLFRKFSATFGVLALLVIMGAAGWYISGAIPGVISGLVIWFLFRNERPVLIDVYQRFTDSESQDAFANTESAAVSVAEETHSISPGKVLR